MLTLPTCTKTKNHGRKLEESSRYKQNSEDRKANKIHTPHNLGSIYCCHDQRSSLRFRKELHNDQRSDWTRTRHPWGWRCHNRRWRAATEHSRRTREPEPSLAWVSTVMPVPEEVEIADLVRTRTVYLESVCRAPLECSAGWIVQPGCIHLIMIVRVIHKRTPLIIIETCKSIADYIIDI